MARELQGISAFIPLFFGNVKTGTNVLVSEFLGNITTENIQPFVETATNSSSGIVTTFFTKTDSTTYIRTATTLKDETGNYAIGTSLSTTSSAYIALQNGLPYVGVVKLYGVEYFAYYIPTFEPGTTFVIGSYFLAFTLESSNLVSPNSSVMANVKLLEYLTGSVFSGVQPYLITENQGNLITETFQPILVNLINFLGKNNNNSIFTRSGDEFIRTATTLVENGQYVVGTTLSKTSPAYLPLLAGESYTGIVVLFGFNYYTRYEPMFDKFTGFVIGAYFSGYGL